MALIVGGTAVDATAAELNIMDGVTSTAAELNELDGFSGDLTAAFTLGTALQFKEVSYGTATSAQHQVIHTINGGDDGVWIGGFVCDFGDAAQVGCTVLYFSTADGVNRSTNDLKNISATGQWSGNTLRISHSHGSDKVIDYFCYQLMIETD